MSSHLEESFEEEIIEIDNYIEDLNDCFKKEKEKNIYRGVDFIDNNLFFFFRCDEMLYEEDNKLILDELSLFNYIVNNIACKIYGAIDKINN